jgi:large subunit ribosomal protein L1
MAKKAELLEQAQALGLKVTAKNTIADIEAAIAGVETSTVSEDTPAEESTATAPKIAKAGKRSAKALAEAEEAEEKEIRKAKVEAGELDPSEESIKKGAAPKIRPMIERRSKGYREVAKKVDENKSYSLADALKLATETSPVKFDASVELHVRLGVDPRQADQNIRGNIVLPNGTGKTVRVAVFGNADDIKAAKAAGADIAAEAEFLDQLKKEEINFDVLISTPQMMSQLGKFARTLGPKGLMPNPKSGTVTTDVAAAVTQAKAGQVEYRVDPTGIVHQGIGKVSFGTEKLSQNADVLMEALNAAKPASIKGIYLLSLYVTTSMGPSIKVAV